MNETSTINKNPIRGEISFEILEDFRNGSSLAFETIYVRWRRPVFSFIYKVVRSSQDAEDITQDVFAKLWNSRERIDPSKNIKTFIFLLARQSIIRQAYRRNLQDSYISESTPSEYDLDSHELLVAEQTKLLIDIAIEKMPEKQREVFSLHYKENLSNEEIAQTLNISTNNVRQHVHNAKKYIKELIMFLVLTFIS